MSILAKLRNSMLPIDLIHALLPKKGLIYEIGSGYGSLGAELARSAPDRRIIALDTDHEKIIQSRKRFKYLTITFERANAVTYTYKKCDGAVLSDFLHHLPFSEQEKVLVHLTRQIKASGVVVIKEIDDADGWRKLMSRLWDFLLYPRDKIYYRSKEQWSVLLRSLGYSVTISREVPWFPGSTYVYLCKKS